MTNRTSPASTIEANCSTPYAAGVCGLIISANPSFTPAQVRDRLVTTAQDIIDSVTYNG